MPSIIPFHLFAKPIQCAALTGNRKIAVHGAETSALYRDIGTIGLHTQFKSLKILDTTHGRRRATTCRMLSDNDGWSLVGRLVEEMRAIEHWDADYWRNHHPEAYELLAFVARRKRHVEILSQLVILIPRLDISEKELLIVGKLSQGPGRRTNVSGGLI